jgi:hypothetical protein
VIYLLIWPQRVDDFKMRRSRISRSVVDRRATCTASGYGAGPADRGRVSSLSRQSDVEDNIGSYVLVIFLVQFGSILSIEHTVQTSE